jgi:NAD-dependent SIR2 family protein deacetylase
MSSQRFIPKPTSNTTMTFIQATNKLSSFLKQFAPKIVVLTGSGISTASGTPSYRDDRRKGTKNKGFEYLEPTSAHIMLSTLETQHKINGVVTQNVDRLHQKAGSQNLCELYGNINAVGFDDFNNDRDNDRASTTNVQDQAAKMVGDAEALLVLGSSCSSFESYELVKGASLANKTILMINIGDTRVDDMVDVKLEHAIDQLLEQVPNMPLDTLVKYSLPAC